MSPLFLFSAAAVPSSGRGSAGEKIKKIKRKKAKARESTGKGAFS